MNQFRTQLLAILKTISLVKKAQITLLSINNEDGYDIESNNPALISDDSFGSLREQIYLQYNTTDEHYVNQDNKIEDIQYYYQKTQEDRYWAIDAKEKNGTVVARKNSERARIPAQSFYGAGRFNLDTNAEYEEFVHAITSRKILDIDEQDLPTTQKEESDSFIFLFGRNILRDEFGEDTVRFYFNLIPNKNIIKDWFRTLSAKLDEREIPFVLKYLSNIKFYKRTDSGVLYIHKQNFSIVAQVVKSVYVDINKAKGFGKNVPLFTRKLKDGLGFAENPFEKKSSFGIKKSTQILNGVIAYLKNQATPLNYTTDECFKYIEKNKLFDLETPYLNTESCYFYDYEIFDKDKNIDLIYYKETDNDNLNASQYFAKLIESKAIWLANSERTWITYSEKNNNINDEVKGFRPVNLKEKAGIEFFLNSLDYWLNKKPKLKGVPNEEPDIKGYKEELEKLKNDNKKEIVGAFDVSKITETIGEELRKRHVNVRFPVPNRFGNYEFNPTLKHGLAFFGYLFLQLHNPLEVEKLTDKFLIMIEEHKDKKSEF